MRAFCQAFLGLAITTTGWAAETRTGAAAMDPYLPIRNSALHFELGVNYANEPGYFAKNDSAPNTELGKATGSEKLDFPSAGSLTTLNFKIRHGFVAGTEALVEIPYCLASGGSQRIEPVKEGDGGGNTKNDTASGGFGDWTFAVKSVYEPWGLGGYFAVVLPVGEIFGSNAYTNGDGQLNVGVMYGKTFGEYVQVLTNFVYGYDLPATNRKIDKQDSYTYYLRLGGMFMEQRIRPYVAYTLEGYGEYVVNKETQADASMRHILTPGIDANLFGDFSAELAVPVVVAGKGNKLVATTSGWGVNVALKYFWYRF